MMKGIVTEIKRFAVHDGDGIRTTVFLKGCSLRCLWCHNPETVSASLSLAFYGEKCTACGRCATVCECHKITDGTHIFDRKSCIACGKCAEECFSGCLTLYGREMTADEVFSVISEDKEFYESSNGGVTVSGGEALCQADFTAELLKKCKKDGINTAVDTCGNVPREAFDKVLPYTDTFLYDIKAMDPSVHKKCTGTDNGRILDNLGYILSKGARVEIRIPYVPGLNDKEIKPIADFLKGKKGIVRVRVLPYHNYAAGKYKALDMKDTLPDVLPTEEEISSAQALFENM